MFIESLLAAALTFSPWYGDVETPEERQQRLTTIARSIDAATLHATCSDEAPALPGLERAAQREGASAAEACTRLWHGSRRALAFLLLAQAYFETRLAAHIHEGKCRTHLGECDGGKAATLWQLQYGPHLPKQRWQQLKGTDLRATTLAAYEATRALSRGLNHCGSLRGAVSLYATGSTCTWKPAEERVAFARRHSARH